MPRFYGHPLGGLQAARSGQVEVAGGGGARLYWEEYGPATGRALFLLNGGCSKIPLMGHVIQVAVEKGYRVLIHESRGIGRSTYAREGRQTSSLLAADAQAVVDSAWGTDSHFCLYGISLGGMIAQELMHRLVASGQGSRIQAVWLTVTGPGAWLRPPPFLQLPLMRMAFKPTPAPPAAPAPAAGSSSGSGDEAGTNGKLSLAKGGGGAMFADDADFAARYSLESLFSTAWLEGPAPPEAIDPDGGAVAGGKAAAAAVPEVHVSVGAGTAGTDARGSGSGRQAVTTRREAVWRVFKTHWRDMLALHGPSDFPAVACQLTVLLGHYLQPARAAAIRSAGLRIGVGVSTRDAFFPEAAQRQLATALGAEVVQVTGAGHMDGAVLDGAYSAFDGGLGWLAAAKHV
ncbi:hypothetical protein HYH02_000623 [Chlamydomonas schloesseri]|uniref:Serine aminopeptidase S33 domain-containing protein n=1 Tax=Chlamydomonas schloesseri TaxID=2026947 RepID=A0A835WX48_9CHLO|nr:hypothetical protein HYH02_000623 [Chlamydomonas schloesseri]|eukprot:KAG2454788.1 hypothetical protein HYH02_000623 [Chlamydomonas schloesseri]